MDYDHNPSEMAAASSVGDVGDESSEEEAEEVEDDVTDLMGLIFLADSGLLRAMPMLEQ